jgi:hypothetical protein
MYFRQRCGSSRLKAEGRAIYSGAPTLGPDRMDPGAGKARTALVESPGADWISKDALIKRMEGQSYSAIVVKADNGHWKGKAVKDGKIVKLHASAKTRRD